MKTFLFFTIFVTDTTPAASLQDETDDDCN